MNEEQYWNWSIENDNLQTPSQYIWDVAGKPCFQLTIIPFYSHIYTEQMLVAVVVVILIRKLAGPHPLHLSYSCGVWILLFMDPHILFDILGTFVSVRLTFLWYLRLLQLYPVSTLENTSIWVIQHSYPGPFSHKHWQVKSSTICRDFYRRQCHSFSN